MMDQNSLAAHIVNTLYKRPYYFVLFIMKSKALCKLDARHVCGFVFQAVDIKNF